MPAVGESQTLALPHLVASRAVPRRYEETKPVHIQGFAHTKIIGLGHELHQRELEKAELEKLQAVRAAEQAVWEEAEKIKAQELARAREDAAIEQDKVIRKLNKAHTRALKEEALKVEMAMQKLAIEQVKLEREEGEIRLKKAVNECQERMIKEKYEAVAKARQEEKKMAAEEAARVAQANKEKFDNAMKKAQNEKTKALKDLRDEKDLEKAKAVQEAEDREWRIAKEKSDLRDEKDLEKAKAVQEAEDRERRIAKEKSDSLSGQYDAVIHKLKLEIKAKQTEIHKLLGGIGDLEKSKSHVEECLMDTRRDFQEFIDTLPPFDIQQAEFLIPAVYLDELQKKGYEVQPLRPPRTKTKSKLGKKRGK